MEFAILISFFSSFFYIHCVWVCMYIWSYIAFHCDNPDVLKCKSTNLIIYSLASVWKFCMSRQILIYIFSSWIFMVVCIVWILKKMNFFYHEWRKGNSQGEDELWNVITDRKIETHFSDVKMIISCGILNKNFK